MCAASEQLSPRDAGALLKAARKKRQLTQEQLIERVGIPNQSYLSALENGRYNVANSEYLPALVRELGLGIEDVRAINPAAVITVEANPVPTDAERRGYKLPPEPEVEIPELLREAARLYGKGQHAPLREERWLRELASLDFREEPETPEDWLAVYVRLSKLIKPR